MTGERTLTRQIVIRVDQSLYDWLGEDAERNGRTVAQSVRFHLHRAAALATRETRP